ncbi:acyltransferase family protein [Hyphobacterium sp.]|uniref:acyltransferase family protein n=1 Tax=Hyphobacterium sp. TaxID=2004662 RepID=UPI003B51D387
MTVESTAIRLANIQALRAIAALLVVAIHVQANELRASADPLLSPWLYHGVAGVDLFFVISGFIMVHVTRGRFGKGSAALEFLYHRALRVYPPVWLFTALAVLGFYAQGTLADWLSRSGLVESFLLIPQRADPLLGVSWTLIHELYFYAIFSCFLLLPQNRLPLALALWSAGIAAGLAFGIGPDSNPWLKLVFHPHTFEFIAGAFAGLLFHHGHYRRPALIAGIGVALFLAGAWVLGLRGPENYPAFWGRVLAFGPGATLIVLGMAGLELQKKMTPTRWLQHVGDWSYSLYLSHILVIAALAHLWAPFARPGPVDNVIMIIAMVALPLIVSAAAYRFYERPTLQLGKKWGRRLFKAPS